MHITLTFIFHIHMLIHVCTYHLWIYFYMYHPYSYYHLSFLIIFHILFVSFYTLLLVLVTIYYYRISVLCFSYHVIYYIHFICIYLLFSFIFHACKYLRSGYGRELYVLEGTITVLDLYVPEVTIIVRDSDIYLYDLNGAAIIIQTGSMS